MKPTFFVIRFPFFLLGLVLGTLWFVPLDILRILATVIGIPFMFIAAAFQNDPFVLEDHCRIGFNVQLPHLYRDLFRWLLEGDRRY